MSKALKSCSKSNKSPNLVTLHWNELLWKMPFPLYFRSLQTSVQFFAASRCCIERWVSNSRPFERAFESVKNLYFVKHLSRHDPLLKLHRKITITFHSFSSILIGCSTFFYQSESLKSALHKKHAQNYLYRYGP